MIWKGIAPFTAIPVLVLVSMGALGQTAERAEDRREVVSLPATDTSSKTSGTISQAECEGDSCLNPPPRITVANPAPSAAAAPWLLRDRIAWIAQLVLVVLGYAGVMLAISVLRKIEKQSKSVASVASAATDAAQAALLHVHALVQAERPWVVVTVEPSPEGPNSFTIVATNRGRSPARIVDSVLQSRMAGDEKLLPLPPAYPQEEPGAPPCSPAILLPGEFLRLKAFSREEARSACDSEQAFKRMENWEEKLFFYGRILYRNLLEPADLLDHETAWCCWYIHGRQRSGLVIAGPEEYNRHS
jgi:hypothetical protein